MFYLEVEQINYSRPIWMDELNDKSYVCTYVHNKLGFKIVVLVFVFDKAHCFALKIPSPIESITTYYFCMSGFSHV